MKGKTRELESEGARERNLNNNINQLIFQIFILNSTQFGDGRRDQNEIPATRMKSPPPERNCRHHIKISATRTKSPPPEQNRRHHHEIAATITKSPPPSRNASSLLWSWKPAAAPRACRRAPVAARPRRPGIRQQSRRRRRWQCDG